MGANTLAYVEGEVRAQAHERDAAVREALSEQDYRKAVALSAHAHGASVGRLCMALVGSQAEAQELAQETFVAAHKAFQSYRGDGSAIGTYPSIWIVTRHEGRWGVQARSSFAP